MTPSLLTVGLLTVADIGSGEGGGGTPSVDSPTVEGFTVVDVAASPFNVTLPADVEENDILIALVGGRSGADIGPPGTYAAQDLFDYDEGGNTRYAGWWRRAGAGEGGSTEQWTTSNPGRQRQCGLVVVRGCIETGAPFDVPLVKVSAYTETPAASSGATVTAGSLVLWTYAQRYDANAPTEDTGYPALADDGVFRRWFQDSTLGVAYKVVESAGAYAGDLWGAWTDEDNLAISVALILKRQV